MAGLSFDRIGSLGSYGRIAWLALAVIAPILVVAGWPGAPAGWAWFPAGAVSLLLAAVFIVGVRGDEPADRRRWRALAALAPGTWAAFLLTWLARSVL